MRFPGGRGGPDRRLPAGRQARPQPARRRHAAEGRHALVQRHRLGQGGQGLGGPARPVRRRVPRRHAGRAAHRRREGGHVGAQVGDHVRRGARGTGGGRAVRPARADHGRTAAASRSSPARPFKAGDLKDGPHRVHREMEAREALGHPHAAEHVRPARSRCWTPAGKVLDTGLAGAVRLPRVLDRRPGLLPQRHAASSSRPCRWTTPRSAPRWPTYDGRPGEPAAPQELRHQLRLHAQLRLRAGLAPELRGDPAGRRRRGDAGLLLPAALRPLRLEGRRRRRRPTATPATPSSTSARRRTTRRSCCTP